MLATLQAAGRGFPRERQERQTISREDALKRAQELFEKRGKDGRGLVRGWGGVLSLCMAVVV